MKRAVVLLSGGIDSTTTLAIAVAQGYDAYALSFDYSQRHHIETEAARRIAKSLGAKEHRIAKIDLRAFGGSALTDEVAVPKQRSEKEIAHGIPITYVNDSRKNTFGTGAAKPAEFEWILDGRFYRHSGKYLPTEASVAMREGKLEKLTIYLR